MNKRIFSIVLLLGLACAVLVGLYLQQTLSGARVQVTFDSQYAHASDAALPAQAYVYSVVKGQQGFLLARAPKGVDGQPTGTPQVIMPLSNSFGAVESDSVTGIELSPDGRYLAINGQQDHGDMVWMYDTVHSTMTILPPQVVGNFLRWLPNGHRFLYRPMFPLGPQAPLDGGTWNPGLWIVDAATGAHSNIALGMPSAYLADAAVSPNGQRIVFSTTPGLGLGSDIWMINSNGSQRTHLFHANGSGQSIAGLFAWSPDGKHIAYERLDDSSTPFLPSGLWTMDAQGGHQHRVASADGGHGYMPVWSPDSQKIAFVVRTNTGVQPANVSSQALQCGIQVINVVNNQSALVSPTQTGVQMNVHPTWSADSTSITFTAMNAANRVLGGSPRYYKATVASRAHVGVNAITPKLLHIVALS